MPCSIGMERPAPSRRPGRSVQEAQKQPPAQQIDFLGAVCKGKRVSCAALTVQWALRAPIRMAGCPLRGGSRFLKLPWRALGQGVQATADISGRGAGQHLLPGRGRTVQAGEKTADLVPDAKENPLHRQIGLTQGQIAMQERQAAGKRPMSRTGTRC